MGRTELKIRIYGDPALRAQAQRLAGITQEERDTLSAMAQLMYDASGIGLAAPQVGIGKAMIVVDIGAGLYKLVNPRIVEASGTQSMEEGCLSVPGICVKIRRSRSVTVKALDEYGVSVRIQAQDLFSRVLQHEIDHLKGILIIDRASFLKKMKFRKQLEKLYKSSHEDMPESKGKYCKVQL